MKGYDTCMRLAGSAELERGKVHYALMPVWMLNTKWQGKDFLFAMNGQTGKLVGDLPGQLGKILGHVCRHRGDLVDRRLHRSHAADDVTGGYGHEKNNNSFADGAFTGAESVCARRGVGGVRFDLR